MGSGGYAAISHKAALAAQKAAQRKAVEKAAFTPDYGAHLTLILCGFLSHCSYVTAVTPPAAASLTLPKLCCPAATAEFR